MGCGRVCCRGCPLRLMAHKRNEVMAEFRGEVEKEKSRRKAAAAKQAKASRGKAA